MNFSFLSRVFLGFFHLGLLACAYAQGKMEFEHLNRNQGLPTNTVTAIVQDKYGMLWFGSQNGLVRFDGYDYKLYVQDPKDTNSVENNFIDYLGLTKDGDLMIGHKGYGFSIYTLETGVFQRFGHDPRNPNSLRNDQVIAMHSDPKGIIWIGTNMGLERFDPKSGLFEHYDIKEGNSSRKAAVSSIVQEPDGQLLLYVSGNKIARFNPKSRSYSFLPITIALNIHLRINRGGVLCLDRKGYLWIGTEFEGLIRYHEKTGEIVKYDTQNSQLKSNVIMQIVEDSEGTVWVATDGGGLMEFGSNSEKPIIHRFDPKDPTSLSSNAVYSVCQTKEGHLWIAAFSAGLNILKKNKKRFELYNDKGLVGKSLNNKSVLSFAEAENGQIWVGTDGGGLNLFDPLKKTFTYYTKENSSICSNVIKTLVNDNDGNLWVGTYASGLCVANFQKKYFKHFLPSDFTNGKSISRFNVWSLSKAKNGNLWIGELDGGLDYYNFEEGKFKNYYHLIPELKKLVTPNFMTVFNDKDDNLWVGTQTEGAYKISGMGNKTTSFRHRPNDPKSIVSDYIQVITQDSEGRIWIGTKQGGLSMLPNPNAVEFVNFNLNNGLPGNTVFSVVEDRKKDIWITTDKGLCKYEPKTGVFRTFDESDGLQSLEFKIGAVYKEASGHICLGGPEGFNRFHPDSIVYNVHAPEVYISGIKLFNKPIEPRQSYNDKVYFTKPIHLLDTLLLSYSDYVLSIDFTGIDYTCPEKNKFAYMLEGFEKDWNTVDANRRSANYTNLAPGQYVFHVKAANNDGVWNEKGRSLIIIVSPPWWQTWWFRILATIAILSALVGFYKWRVRQISARNILLQKAVQERTAELREANEHLSNSNEEIRLSNEQLEKQNSEILKMNEQILLQKKEILEQKDELELKNNQLNQINATKDKLISIIGHDLRNPVSALTSLTDMLQGMYKSLSENDITQILGHIQASSTSLKLLVNNLLDWALVQSKHVEPQPKKVDVAKAAEECFKLLKLHAEGKGIQFDLITMEEHLVFADPNMLKTILRNLVGNAVKFTPEGGSISISSEHTEKGELLITVSDTGVGMTQDKIDQLLDNQLIGTTSGTSNEKGTGLGLVIVREFIEANRGRLEITSTPNQGTKFKIYLPVAE